MVANRVRGRRGYEYSTSGLGVRVGSCVVATFSWSVFANQSFRRVICIKSFGCFQDCFHFRLVLFSSTDAFIAFHLMRS